MWHCVQPWFGRLSFFPHTDSAHQHSLQRYSIRDVFTQLTFPNRYFTWDWLQRLQMPEGSHAARSNKKGLVFLHIPTSCRIISEIVLNSVLCNDKVFLYLLPNLWPLEPKVAAAKGWLCEPAEAFTVGSWSGSGVISFVPPGLPAGLDKDSSRQLLLVLSCP